MKKKFIEISSDLSSLIDESLLEKYLKLTQGVIQNMLKRKERTVEYILIYHCGFSVYPINSEVLKSRLFCLTSHTSEDYILDYDTEMEQNICSFKTLSDIPKDPTQRPVFSLRFNTPFDIDNQHLIQFIKSEYCVCYVPMIGSITIDSNDHQEKVTELGCRMCNRKIKMKDEN